MKECWSEDSQVITVEIDNLIASKAEVICGRRSPKEIKKLPLIAKSKSSAGDLLVVHHPHEPSCALEKCLFYYHIKGGPLRCFESLRIKKVKDMLGLRYPGAIYNIHRRQFPRIKAANNSRVVFSLLNKQRLYYGTVDDISLEGAKFLVDISTRIAVGDTLCHLTLTLCTRFSSVDEIITHIPEAKVIWIKGDGDAIRSMGVKFAWHEKLQEPLSTYIDLRSIEDP